jgi:molybdenum cofactor biosynthesis protein B
MMEDRDHTTRREKPARCAVFTVSDSRTVETDRSGGLIRQLLAEQGHAVIEYRLVKNDPTILRQELSTFLDSDLDLLITTGGTGVGRRDLTIETVMPLLDKTIPGFGELFRHLSFQTIGSRALMSRALGGVANNKLVFALPGSTDAVRLALRELILPELGHLMWEINR